MDVLDHWRPLVDWTNFNQGPLSDAVWDRFKQVVQLCQAFRHWDEDARQKRLSPPRHYEFPPEDKRQFEQRKDQWEADIRRSEQHRNRARFLADQTVVECSHLGSKAAEGTADWKLGFALRLAVRAHPEAAAFESFDADQEIKDGADQIGLRWLREAGYEYAK
jgi:hypothetical protein